MSRLINTVIALNALFFLTAHPAAVAQPHPGSEAFIERAVSEYELDPERVATLLESGAYQERIADLMAKPAEGKPWFDYRPIFITDQRLEEGLEFWAANAELIAAAAETYGVDPQVIVSIIGIETYYGRITGDFRVLDALTTLSFYYPSDRTRDRSDFFSKELLEYMVLGSEEQLPIEDITGSYAGAMGMGQFMPSSYRAYAVDGDGDGQRDLWRSTADVVGSVANYLAVHGWEPGGPIVRPATLAGDADRTLLESRNFKPHMTIQAMHEAGFRGAADLEPGREGALVALQRKDEEAIWMTFKNFYVITRYNRSPMYAMVVYQLSEALREGMAQ